MMRCGKRRIEAMHCEGWQDVEYQLSHARFRFHRLFKLSLPVFSCDKPKQVMSQIQTILWISYITVEFI